MIITKSTDCKTCGNNHPENYCPACGEKSFSTKQLSLKHFVEETFESFIHFDNKFLRTVKTLIAKPGQLTLDYTEGRRVYFMRPMQLFLVVNLVFFIMAFHNMYSLTLPNYLNFRPFTNFNTKHIIDEALIKTKHTLPEYTDIFNGKIKEISKTYIFLFIPIYGLMFRILFFKKKEYFVEHLVFATHFMSFVLLLTLVSLYLILLPYFAITHNQPGSDFETIHSWFFEVVVALYAAFAIHRFYKPHIIWTIITAVIVGYSFFTIIQYYRMLLFYKIVYL
jgi:hypothetical protein